jgi:hypothetical protein
LKDILVFGPAQLQAFTLRLFSSTYVSQNSIGASIRKFGYDVSSDTDDSEETLMSNVDINQTMVSAIMQMSQLQIYDTSGIISDRLTCISLSTMCAATLSVLEIDVKSNADGVIPVLNTLRQLTRLCLWFRKGTWTHNSSLPLNLPSLGFLLWSHPQDQATMLTTLAQSSFEMPICIQLQLANLRRERAHILRPLLASSLIEDAILDISKDAMILLAPDIVRIPAIRFIDVMPPPSLLDAETVPDQLTLAYPQSNANSEQASFWTFLDHLLASKHTLPEDFLRIDYEIDTRFDWFGDSTEAYSIFIGRLLKMAANFYKRGVIITDIHGRDVKSLVDED